MNLENLLGDKNVRVLLFCALLVVLWQATVWLNIWPPYIFPSPSGVFKALVTGFSDGTFITATIASLYRMLIGFGAALVIGVILGTLTSQSRVLEDTVGQLVLGLQTLPSICWLPLAILWFGLSDKAIIFVVIAGAVCSITMAIDSGIRNVPPLYIDAAKTMGASKRNLYLYVIFPAALPTIISGVRQGWSFAWRSLMAGELLFFTAGIGQLLQIGRDLNDINQVIAVMLLVVSIGLLIERLVFWNIEKKIRKRWGLLRSA